MRKQIISGLMAMAMVFTMLPTTARATGTDPAQQDHGQHTSWKEFDPSNSGSDGLSYSLGTGMHYLTKDVTCDRDIVIDDSSNGVTLCLNGHVLDLNGHRIKLNNSLTICDCQTTTTYGNIDDNGLWKKSDTSGNCNLTGGVITGGKNTDGNGTISNGTTSLKATLVLESGNIAGNTANNGGAVL